MPETGRALWSWHHHFCPRRQVCASSHQTERPAPWITPTPLLTGWLREHYGYHAGFFSAAVGMAFALGAFIYGRHKLSAFAFTVPNPIRPQERRRLLLGASASWSPSAPSWPPSRRSPATW